MKEMIIRGNNETSLTLKKAKIKKKYIDIK